MIDWRARSAERVPIARPGEFNAPLFRSLIEQLDEDKRWIVLDLGAAHTQTISLFSHYRCRLDIADLADGLDALCETQDDGPPLDEIAETLLPNRQDEPIDVILCWDILNYLDLAGLAAVMSRVAARSKRGALVHALIVYSETHMSEQPGHYVPLDDLSLIDMSHHTRQRLAPRYSPDDLNRALPDFSVERAMLLGNGMQEFLFRL